MTDPIKTAQDDLAFMRSLVEHGGRAGTSGGSVFLAAGLLYGLQCLFHWGQMRGWIDAPDLVNLLFSAGPTAAFLVILCVVLWRDRKRTETGSQSRAVQGMFAGIGLANLVMVAVFAVNAARQQDFQIWLFYPAVIFALQGAAWFAVWQVRRRGWLGAVALGWLAASLALGLSIDALERYILIAALSLLLLMALPGAVMMRLARQNG